MLRNRLRTEIRSAFTSLIVLIRSEAPVQIGRYFLGVYNLIYNQIQHCRNKNWEEFFYQEKNDDLIENYFKYHPNESIERAEHLLSHYYSPEETKRMIFKHYHWPRLFVLQSQNPSGLVNRAELDTEINEASEMLRT